VIPFAVIAMLVISLWESIFVLPCHLSHKHTGFFKFVAILIYPFRPLGIVLNWLSIRAGRGMEWICQNAYLPALKLSLRHPPIPIAFAIAMFLITFGLLRGGVVPYNLFPKSDNNNLQATIVFPDGTTAFETDKATRIMEQALRNVSEKVGNDRSTESGVPVEEIYKTSAGIGTGPVRMTYRDVGTITNLQNPAGGGGSGSHAGQIFAELYDTEIRDIHSDELLAMWREEAGEIAGAERIVYGSVGVGPGGTPIEFKLLAPGEHFDQLLDATEEVKKRLGEFAGVYDIADDNTPGKFEFQFRIKDTALATGVTPTDLGRTVRNAYFGAEVMRLQRGRHEVKLMVRYPERERRSLVNFREIRVRTGDGSERPISELAEIEVERGYSEINRVDQMRSITISADVDENKANASLIISELQEDFIPELQQEFPAIAVRWEGQREQSNESVGSLMAGFAIAILAMFVLLVLQFRSYIQPLLILAIVPFGMIGAVWGHAILGLPLTLFSMFGLVALSGVVINDSIVLIDFINSRVRAGVPFHDALIESGERRFRPIMLTSLTTIAGLIPLMLERSFQAQLLIPMAASLAFGLMLATFLVLLLVPTFYSLYVSFIDVLGISLVEDE
jgi:HAE1 family hydrophobic/amphiphilic exporter-1